MSAYMVTAFVNVGPDNFSGYTPDAPMAEVGTYSIGADSHIGAANRFFGVGNKMAQDADGTDYPSDVRSLSVGDMLTIRDATKQVVILSVDRFGWTEIPEPSNPIVALTGSSATSRM